MDTWANRPRDEAYLFNPAFSATLMSVAVHGYYQQGSATMPLYLVPMVLPIVLHKQTRVALPRTLTTSMAVWLSNNPMARAGYHQRLMSLKNYSMEAVRFAIRDGSVELRTEFESRLLPQLSAQDVDKRIKALADEAKECAQKAKFFGRWMALSDPITVMEYWGIRL